MYKTKRSARRPDVLLATIALAMPALAIFLVASGAEAKPGEHPGLKSTGLEAVFPSDVSCGKIRYRFGVYKSDAPHNFTHSGDDILGNTGDEIVAVADGTILEIFQYKRAETLVIQHRPSQTGLGKWTYSIYVHNLSNYPQEVHEKVKIKRRELEVKKGQTIAYMGSTGTKFTHLHFDFKSADNENYGIVTTRDGKYIGVSGMVYVDPLLAMAGTLNIDELPNKKVQIPLDPSKGKLLWPVKCR